MAVSEPVFLEFHQTCRFTRKLRGNLHIHNFGEKLLDWTCGLSLENCCAKQLPYPFHNWVAPCKPAPSDYFVAIFQVAHNQLKFGMSTLFVLKNVPVFFFKNADNYGQNCVEFNTPPPPPSLSVCACACAFHAIGGRLRRGGGELSRMCLKPCFPTCGKKNTDIF